MTLYAIAHFRQGWIWFFYCHTSASNEAPRVEWRGLEIWGGKLIHRKCVFCIFRCQSIGVGISAKIRVTEYFEKMIFFGFDSFTAIHQPGMYQEAEYSTHTHLLLRNSLSPFLYLSPSRSLPTHQSVYVYTYIWQVAYPWWVMRRLIHSSPRVSLSLILFFLFSLFRMLCLRERALQ